MTVNVHVSCIRKRQHHNPHERIEGLGGVYKGERWYLTEDDIIAELEKPSATRRWDFYTKVNGHVAWVVIDERRGRKYLKTMADGYEENNLLDLNECPQA